MDSKEQLTSLLHGVHELVDLQAAGGKTWVLTRRLRTDSLTTVGWLFRFEGVRIAAEREVNAQTTALVCDREGSRLLMVDPGGVDTLDPATLETRSRWTSERPIRRVVVHGTTQAWVAVQEAEGLQVLALHDGASRCQHPPLEDFDVSSDGRWVLTTPTRYQGGVTNELLLSTGGGWEPIATDLRWHGRPRFSTLGDQLAVFGSASSMPTAEFPLSKAWIASSTGGDGQLTARLAMAHPSGRADPGVRWTVDGEPIFRSAHEGDIGIASPDRMVVDGDRQVLSFAVDGLRLVWIESTAEHSLSLCVRVNDATQRYAFNPSLDAWLASIPRRRMRFEGPEGRPIRGELLGLTTKGPRPLLLSIHGGPHGFLGPGVAQTHFYRWLLAERGWCVLTLDPSGSGTYSDEHTLRIRERWGEVDAAEVLSAIDSLVASGAVDGNRLALSGYSYGGYLGAQLASRTARFQTATLGAPVLDLRRWRDESDIGPTFLGWHFDDSRPGFAERLEAASVKVPPLGHPTRVLWLQGAADVRCPGIQAHRYAKACRDLKLTAELVEFEGEGHGLPGSGTLAARIEYHRRVVDWHLQHGPKS